MIQERMAFMTKKFSMRQLNFEINDDYILPDIISRFWKYVFTFYDVKSESHSSIKEIKPWPEHLIYSLSIDIGDE